MLICELISLSGCLFRGTICFKTPLTLTCLIISIFFFLCRKTFRAGFCFQGFNFGDGFFVLCKCIGLFLISVFY